MSSESINKPGRTLDSALEGKIYRRPDTRQNDDQQDRLEVGQTGNLTMDENDRAADDNLIEASAIDRHETCMICNERHLGGLHLGDEFICAACEREIVQTDVSDAKYPYFIHRMKQLWRRKNA